MKATEEEETDSSYLTNAPQHYSGPDFYAKYGTLQSGKEASAYECILPPLVQKASVLLRNTVIVHHNHHDSVEQQKQFL